MSVFFPTHTLFHMNKLRYVFRARNNGTGMNRISTPTRSGKLKPKSGEFKFQITQYYMQSRIFDISKLRVCSLVPLGQLWSHIRLNNKVPLSRTWVDPFAHTCTRRIPGKSFTSDYTDRMGSVFFPGDPREYIVLSVVLYIEYMLECRMSGAD